MSASFTFIDLTLLGIKPESSASEAHAMSAPLSELHLLSRDFLNGENTFMSQNKAITLKFYFRSYPVCMVVPMSVTDEQIKSLAHCHHQSRFPAAVWIHPDTKAVLLRSSAIRSRTANSLFKHGQQKCENSWFVMKCSFSLCKIQHVHKKLKLHVLKSALL